MLHVSHISKRFGTKTVADDISFQIENGKLLAVLGPSGCGKSTLLKIITGLITPDSGSIFLNGDDITDKPSEQRHISLMFQDYALFPHLNVVDNAAFGLRMHGLNKTQATQQALHALEEVGLMPLAQRSIEGLSGGEQQRLALARALAAEPALLLLDEAFSSLDSHLRRQLNQLTLTQIRKQNIPAILVTHSPTEALTMADNIMLLHQGKILQSGTTEAVWQKPANAQAAKLLGLENVNEAYYLPQHAISIHPQPEPRYLACPVLESTDLPDRFNLIIRHSQYGNITLNLSPQSSSLIQALRHRHEIYVYVDENQVIHFNH